MSSDLGSTTTQGSTFTKVPTPLYQGSSVQAQQLEDDVSSIINEQMANGWLVDQEKVFMLLAELKEKKIEYEEAVHQTFRPIAKAVREITPKVTQDGRLSKVGLKFLGDRCLDIVGGPFTRIEFEEFNLGSRQQTAERLQALGWKPTEFTEKGNVSLTDDVLCGLEGFPEAELISQYMTVVRRVAMAQSWVTFADSEGRVHGLVDSNGAVTGRMTHEQPNVAQVTAGAKLYGTEMRQCWIAREGYDIVGCDAAGLELRMLAHYMNDADYMREVLDGDVHTANQRAAGLATRDQAKTFIYAFLYGAGDAKIGSIVGGTANEGKRLKAKFLRNTPALAALRDRVQTAAKRGWLLGLDGRRIAVRSSHAALNTLLQGAGAVLMKQALVNLHKAATAQKLDFYLVGNIHDEIQSEVLRAHSQQYGKLAVWSINKAGAQLGLRCPTTGEYKVGSSWAETH